MQHRFTDILTRVVLVAGLCLPAVASAKSAVKVRLLTSTQSKTPSDKDVPKISLGDGFITQNTLRVYLDVPASLSVYNTRGQLVFHLESDQKLVLVPLQGIPTGFLYLTLRSGQYELTKKLVYSGK